MTTTRSLTSATAFCAAVALAASAARAQQPAKAAPDSMHAPYTAADVSFMTGMIAHHAQALLMAGWAPTHGASPQVRTLCERITVAQTDEIASMQTWLRDRGLPVPSGKPAAGTMPGMDHMMMPGMLSGAQLASLDSARGTEFDRAFLVFMIQHHQGALTMVDQVMNSTGAMRDDLLYKIASDISADQTAEIDRMKKMFAALPPGGTAK
jgi:uncharacterized protein (DUF305 family)